MTATPFYGRHAEEAALKHAWQLCRSGSNLIVATAIVKKFDCVCFPENNLFQIPFGWECRGNGQYWSR